MSYDRSPPGLFHAILPIAVLLALVGYGLISRPLLFDQAAVPTELIFVAAGAFAVGHLAWLGHTWGEIQTSVIKQLTPAVPALLILLSIGLVIGSWMLCGTIPMLVYYGLELIQPNYLYCFALVVPIVFSLLTGTSWGSIGAVGVVFIAIAHATGANVGITAGAVVGGAFFGDKLSPLSDTTNIAAVAAGTGLFDHVRSMLYTTLPAAGLALIAYLILGFVYPPQSAAGALPAQAELLETLDKGFRFHVILLVPPLLILAGSLKKVATVPLMVISAIVASLLALTVQGASFDALVQTLHQGFSLEALPRLAGSHNVLAKPLLERGGLFALKDAIFITLIVFVFIGALARIDAVPRVIERIFGAAKTRKGTVLASLVATAATNSLCANQYATSFIVGDAFKQRYDAVGVPRNVLSRSLEDYGTMFENLIPWTPSAVFIIGTLDISHADYWHWQLVSLFNLVIAPLIVVLGVGCYVDMKEEK